MNSKAFTNHLAVTFAAFFFGIMSANAQTPPPLPSCHAANVVSYNPGLQKNGLPVDSNRTDPTQALGAPDGTDIYNFVSLGIGGELILDFGFCPNNLPKQAVGPITIVETSFGDPSCTIYPETADVYGRSHLSDPWTYLGQVCLDGSVDISPLPYIVQIRFVDVTGNNTGSRDGFDVDGITAQCSDCVVQPIICSSPDTVIDYLQGMRRNGTVVNANRSLTGRATGDPEDDDTYNFYSLGYGGYITLGWSTGVIIDGPGNDLRIVETSFKSPACRRWPESCSIDVSQDNITWYAVDSFCQDGEIDIATSGLTYIQYIRITDVTKPYGGGTTDGYDIDGVACIGGTNKTAPLVAAGGKLIEDDYFSVYPNPANEIASIRVSGTAESNLTVWVYNTLGQIVAQYEDQGLIEEDMNVSHLPKGIYFIKADIDGAVITEKLIVQ